MSDEPLTFAEMLAIAKALAKEADDLRAVITAAYDELQDLGGCLDPGCPNRVDFTSPAMLALADEVDR